METLPSDANLFLNIPVPYAYSFSKIGYPVPYLHPHLKVARPRPFPHSKNRWALYWVPIIGTMLASKCALKLLNGRRPVKVSGLSKLLQKVNFHQLTQYHDYQKSFVRVLRQASEQVGVMFPGELFADPIDIGIVETVIVLNAMGIRTTSCCEGHGGSGCLAYIAIAATHDFPASLIKTLDESRVAYHVSKSMGSTTQGIYSDSVAGNKAFCSALRSWAHRQAPDVLSDVAL